MGLETETIKRIYNIAKEYETPGLNAEDLFQIGFIGHMRAEHLGLTEEKLIIELIRAEIEVFLKTQTNSQM